MTQSGVVEGGGGGLKTLTYVGPWGSQATCRTKQVVQ